MIHVWETPGRAIPRCCTLCWMIQARYIQASKRWSEVARYYEKNMIVVGRALAPSYYNKQRDSGWLRYTDQMTSNGNNNWTRYDVVLYTTDIILHRRGHTHTHGVSSHTHTQSEKTLIHHTIRSSHKASKYILLYKQKDERNVEHITTKLNT